MQCSNIVIPNPEIRHAFTQRTLANGVTGLNPFALAATEAAYTKSGDWLDQCVDYLESNLQYALRFFKEHIPQIKAMTPEATYLLWLDCSTLKMSSNELHRLFNQNAKVYLDDGIVFGEEGNSSVRMNFALSLIHI